MKKILLTAIIAAFMISPVMAKDKVKNSSKIGGRAYGKFIWWIILDNDNNKTKLKMPSHKSGINKKSTSTRMSPKFRKR